MTGASTPWLALGLLLLQACNILLGIAKAKVEGLRFECDKFLHGLIKAAAVVLALVLLWGAGTLNQDVVVMDTGNGALTILDAVQAGMLAAFVAYAGKAIGNAKSIMMQEYKTLPEREKTDAYMQSQMHKGGKVYE